MNKKILVKKIAEEVGISTALAERIYHAMMDSIANSLKNGEKVKLAKFGTFEVRPRAARIAHHPQTREEIQVPAKKVARFRPSQALKDAVN
ncbi:MAG: HU family DNA-binding protein [Ardenticatenaceae bacterium]